MYKNVKKLISNVPTIGNRTKLHRFKQQQLLHVNYKQNQLMDHSLHHKLIYLSILLNDIKVIIYGRTQKISKGLLFRIIERVNFSQKALTKKENKQQEIQLKEHSLHYKLIYPNVSLSIHKNNHIYDKIQKKFYNKLIFNNLVIAGWFSFLVQKAIPLKEGSFPTKNT